MRRSRLDANYTILPELGTDFPEDYKKYLGMDAESFCKDVVSYSHRSPLKMLKWLCIVSVYIYLIACTESNVSGVLNNYFSFIMFS